MNYAQSGTIITIHVLNDSIHLFDFSQASHADLDVRVPVDSDLQLETDSGDISVTGIHGKMTLSSNSGTITSDFPIARAQQPGAESETVSGDVDSSPQTTVTLQSDSGSLHLAHM